MVLLQPIRDNSSHYNDSQDVIDLSSCLSALVINGFGTNSNHTTPESSQQRPLYNTPVDNQTSPEQIIYKPKIFNIRIIGSSSSSSSDGIDKAISLSEFKTKDSLLKIDYNNNARSSSKDNQFRVAIKRHWYNSSLSNADDTSPPYKTPRYEDIWVSKEWKEFEILRYMKQRSFYFNDELCATPIRTPKIKDDVDDGIDLNSEINSVADDENESNEENSESHSSSSDELDNADEDYERLEEMIMSHNVRYDFFNLPED